MKPPFRVSDTLNREFFKYLATMGLWTLVDYALVLLLLNFSLRPTISVTIAYLVSITMNFFHQKRYTFGQQNKHEARELFRYLVAVLICWSLIVSFVYFFTELLGWHTVLAKLASQPFTFVCGFLLMRHYVFPKNDGSELEKEGI